MGDNNLPWAALLQLYQWNLRQFQFTGGLLARRGICLLHLSTGSVGRLPKIRFWQVILTAMICAATQHSWNHSTMRSCKGGGNTTESSVPLRSRPCPGALHRSMAAATQSMRAQSTENTARHSTATLDQHKMALPCSCTTYIHQNPVRVTDKLPADRKAAKNQLHTTYCTDLMLQLD